MLSSLHPVVIFRQDGAQLRYSLEVSYWIKNCLITGMKEEALSVDQLVSQIWAFLISFFIEIYQRYGLLNSWSLLNANEEKKHCDNLKPFCRKFKERMENSQARLQNLWNTWWNAKTYYRKVLLLFFSILIMFQIFSETLYTSRRNKLSRANHKLVADWFAFFEVSIVFDYFLCSPLIIFTECRPTLSFVHWQYVGFLVTKKKETEHLRFKLFLLMPNFITLKVISFFAIIDKLKFSK